MQVIVVTDLESVRKPTAIALGNFDGVHRGHRRVIEPVLHRSGLVSTVVTFSPHPRDFFSGTSSLLLTPLAEKVALLEGMGVEQLVVLQFTRELASLTAARFVTDILQGGLEARLVSVGCDFRFGSQRQGDVELLRSFFPDGVLVTAEQRLEGVSSIRISSSAIKTALEEGNVALANDLLGRRYSITGRVVAGQQLGRQLGFPTANLQVDPQKFLPRDGVYAVLWRGQPGVMNIGVRPTVGGELKRTVEVHLLDWQGNLYDQVMTVELLRFIREERKFASLAELQAQIGRDCEVALGCSQLAQNC